MKTTEERVEEWAKSVGPWITTYDEKAIDDAELDECLNVTVKEVKRIMIEKACEWIMDELRNPKADTFQEFVDNFKKAMEE